MKKYDAEKLGKEVCPKCGASMAFHKVEHSPLRIGYESNKVIAEHLEISCHICSYITKYLPLDTEESN